MMKTTMLMMNVMTIVIPMATLMAIATMIMMLLIAVGVEEDAS